MRVIFRYALLLGSEKYSLEGINSLIEAIRYVQQTYGGTGEMTIVEERWRFIDQSETTVPTGIPQQQSTH